MPKQPWGSVLLLPILFLATPSLAAEVIKCKIESTRTYFAITLNGNGTADVSIRTLPEPMKPMYRGVPFTRSQNGVLDAVASPAYFVGTGQKNGCVELQKEYSLHLVPKDAKVYKGDLEELPYFKQLPDNERRCKGFPAPEVIGDLHRNVFCEKSSQQ